MPETTTARVESICRHCGHRIVTEGLIEGTDLSLGQFHHVVDGEHFCSPTGEEFALPTDDAMGAPSMTIEGVVLLGSPIDIYAAKVREGWAVIQARLAKEEA